MTLRTFISNNKTILILFLLALSFRLIFLFFFEQFPVTHDGLHYNIIAENMLKGNGFSYDSVNPTAARGPLYPSFLAITYYIFGYDYNAVRIMQAIIGAITCIFIYLIGKEFFSSFVAFYASLIASIYPALIGYSGLLNSETLAGFLLCLAILSFIICCRKKSSVFFISTGVFLGLLILCYPKFMFLPIVFLTSFYYCTKGKNHIKYSLGLILGVFLIVAPWTLRNFNEFGKFIPVSTGVGPTLWYATLPQDYTEWHFDDEFKKSFFDPESIDEQHEFLFSVKTNEAFMQKALNNIKNNPLMFISLSIKRFFRQWFSSNSNSIYALKGATGSYLLCKNYSIFSIKLFLFLLQIYIIVFGCMGILVDFNLNRKNIFSPIFLAIFYSSIINSIFMASPRYQIPVLGLLFIYTALGSRWAFLELSKPKKFIKINPLSIIKI